MSSPISTRREGGILEVTLDRPKANAINLQTSREMGLVFESFRDEPELRESGADMIVSDVQPIIEKLG